MRHCIWAIITVLLLLPVTAGHVSAKKEPAEAADFWTADRVHTIHIRITNKQWQILQPASGRRGRDYLVASAVPAPSAAPSNQPALVLPPASTQPVVHHEGDRLAPNFYGYEFAYVKARFECDGVALNDIGFKQRGNSSYGWGSSGYKRPYKVSFGQYVDGQKFDGLSGFYLNNNAYDPSFLRETLSYEGFRKLGVPAPRTTFALVYLTIDGRIENELLGLYTLIEKVDSNSFLKRHFGSSKGMLMKPWSIHGLPYAGEQWEAYEAHYNARATATPDGARRTIDFIKLVNYADDATFQRQIADYLDVENFLGYVAGNVIYANLDNLFYTGHNFYLYLSPKDDRFRFMPWDMNLSFANYTSAASSDQAVNLSIMHPHTGNARIVDRLLAIPKYRQFYRDLVARYLQTQFTEKAMFARIDALQSVLAKADQAADEAWKAKFAAKVPVGAATRPAAKIPPRPVQQFTGWSGQPAIPLKTFVTRRIASLQEQLAGETDGYSPGYRRTATPPPGGLRAHAAYGSLLYTSSLVMRSADNNCDSRLTLKEVTTAISEFFTQADTGKQNSLDQAKLTRALTRTFEEAMQRRPDRSERNNPRPVVRLVDSAGPWAIAIITTVDTGKTGRITLDQLLSATERAFVAADKDKSGKLDENELLVLLDTLAASAPPAAPATRPSR